MNITLQTSNNCNLNNNPNKNNFNLFFPLTKCNLTN